MSTSKFKVGDIVRVIQSDESYGLYEDSVHTVTDVHPMGNVELSGIDRVFWSPARLVLVPDAVVLTPEEVFEHLRKGTKLQLQNSYSGRWCDLIAPKYVSYEEITTKQWRIKPEPKIITLNGKRYQALED